MVSGLSARRSNIAGPKIGDRRTQEPQVPRHITAVCTPFTGSYESDSDIEVLDSPPAARHQAKPAAKKCWSNQPSPLTSSNESDSDSSIEILESPPAPRHAAKPAAKKQWILRDSPCMSLSESSSSSESEWEESPAASRSSESATKKPCGRASPSTKSTESNTDSDDQESSTTRYTDRPVVSNLIRKSAASSRTPNFSNTNESDTEGEEQEPAARKKSTGSNEDEEEEQDSLSSEGHWEKSPAASRSPKPAAKKRCGRASACTRSTESNTDSDDQESLAARHSVRPAASKPIRKPAASSRTPNFSNASESDSGGEEQEPAARKKPTGSNEDKEREQDSSSSEGYWEKPSRSSKPAAKKRRGRASPSTRSTESNTNIDDQESSAASHSIRPAGSNPIRKPAADSPTPNVSNASESDSDREEHEQATRESPTGSSENNEEEQDPSAVRRSARDRKLTDLAAKNLHHNYTESPKKRKKKFVEESNEESKARTTKRPRTKRKRKQAEQEFVVDKVLNQNIVLNGRGNYVIEYELSWVGYSQNENCWESPESMNGEDILLEAFSKFPTSAEACVDEGTYHVEGLGRPIQAVEDEYVYSEKDLERCTAYYDQWVKQNPKEARDTFVEIKTDRVHLRIGMWYKSRENDEQRLLIARLDKRNKVAKCLLFIPSTNTILKDTHAAEDGKVKYLYYKDSSVPFDDLCERHIRCKGSIPTCKWCYSETSEHEFTIAIESKTNQSLPTQINYGIKKPKVLVLCAGSSFGMSCGYGEGGLEVAWMVEKDEQKAKWLRRQYSDQAKSEGRKPPVYQESVHRFVNKLQNDRYESIKKDVDHIHLSAPLRGRDYEDNEIAEAFVACVKNLKPKTGIYDSSLDLLLEENIEILETMIGCLHRLDYQIRLMILDASEYGDPIETKRVVLCIAKETAYLPNRPIATHGGGRFNDFLTVEDELCFLEDTPPRSVVEICGQQIYHHTSPSHTPTAEECEMFGLRQEVQSYVPTDEECEEFALDPSKVAPDMTGTNRFIHYNKERFLTIRELLCLKSFDKFKKYELFDSEQEMLQQIADAMPFKIARAIARSIAPSYCTTYFN
ncbi:unnamed protein product [Cylindrotheca closterium]|uniref:Chromo domain-containing protein n=1 Tax=Cylindrotheca closterium TaxID=2856 RepID=A0AAD2FC29_9STRA|nr:unnamed protein product [Cylindrotheca closterium]